MDEQLAEVNADYELAKTEVNKLKGEKKQMSEELEGVKKVKKNITTSESCFNLQGIIGKKNMRKENVHYLLLINLKIYKYCYVPGWAAIQHVKLVSAVIVRAPVARYICVF